MPCPRHLRRLLHALEPADAREREHRERVLALLDESADPFSRAQFAPGHVTASAFVTNPASDALLLILHGKLGLWLQPGGHVEPTDDDVLATARREVREELGINAVDVVGDGLLDVDVHPIPARANDPAHAHFDVRFLFSTAADSFQAGSDARAARWVPIAALLGPKPDRSLTTDESVLRAVRKLARLGKNASWA
jgi:8-oxo-dGTP pyrophosphatase MutT (NUDIX family)